MKNTLSLFIFPYQTGFNEVSTTEHIPSGIEDPHGVLSPLFFVRGGLTYPSDFLFSPFTSKKPKISDTE